jgi:hypothetical protein
MLPCFRHSLAIADCAALFVFALPADPATNTAFIAIATVDAAMLKGHPSDGLGPDHLQLPEVNPCGVIISISVNDQFEATSAQVGPSAAASGVRRLPRTVPLFAVALQSLHAIQSVTVSNPKAALRQFVLCRIICHTK